MHTRLITLLAVSLLFASIACSDDANDPVPDASSHSPADAGPASDATPVVDAMQTGAGLGELCGQDAEGITCGAELACCYPCGISGCEFTCTEACDDGDPGCSDGCLALP